jgi:predicted ATPase
MIETLTLRGYRGHTATTIPCGRLTVLVGENATGKTSALRAVRWISEGIGPTLPAHQLRHGANELAVILTGRGPDGGFRIEAAYAQHDRKDIVHQVRASVLKDDGSTGLRPRATFLTLNAEALAAPSGSKQLVPTLDPSGRGLASVLAHLKLAETDRFERIVERLRAVVPISRGIGFERVAASETIPRVIRVEDRQIELSDTVTVIQDGLVLDFADADKVPASLVSEGTLLTLGMLTALEIFDREREAGIDGRVIHDPVDVVLIDDIDRALHPRAQRQLVETLRLALDATPNLQILATSHSPYLIDALRSDEVVVLGRDAQNVVVAKRLDAFPDERLRKMLSTGELWMSEGDGWASR